MEGIADAVRKSSKQGLNIPAIVNEDVSFKDWSKYCHENFKPLPGLKKYHHFRMTSSAPGVVYVREYASEEEVEVNILKKKSKVIGTFPEKLKLNGLDPLWQWYLYQEIGHLCANSENACPKPEVPKPKKNKLE